MHTGQKLYRKAKKLIPGGTMLLSKRPEMFLSDLGNDEGLDQHLLLGLEPVGVPSHLKGSSIPFLYNNYQELENLVKNHNIGVIKMEEQRNHLPKEGCLQRIRKLATDYDIVLIFDECTSDFRETFGPIFKKYNVEPDIAVFGKTIANGYALTAVVGKKEIMKAAQNTFISSTFWTERIGSAAALKTLEIMEKEKPWNYIPKMRTYITSKWKELAHNNNNNNNNNNNLEINTFGIPSLASFFFTSKDTLKYKTLITQELIKKGCLASTVLYSSTTHTKTIIDTYLDQLNTVFQTIERCKKNDLNIDDLLESPVCHGGFTFELKLEMQSNDFS